MPLEKSRWACACLRLIQVQMSICYFFAGTKKLQGETWWSGEALWYALTNFEFHNFPVTFFANNYWLINLLTYATIILELSYPFLIWGKKTRPFMLAGAFALHMGIAVFMGLYLFALAMIFGHLSFFCREWYSFLATKWKNYMGPLEILYDGNCGFCLSSIKFLLVLDGLKQIKLRNFRINPLKDISIEQQDNDLHLVANERVYKGFNAYKYLVTKIPGLWFLIPFFYVPVISDAIGNVLYRWVAKNRHFLSSCLIQEERI